MIKVNFEKAKEITKNRLRTEREPLFQKLDVEFQKNLEIGNDNPEVIQEKQRLRDLPQLADSCSTLDELKSLKP
jgi:hypothetical protein